MDQNYYIYKLLHQIHENLYKNGLLELTFIISLSLIPVMFFIILTEACYITLYKGSYVSDRRRYARWLFLKLIGRLNVINTRQKIPQNIKFVTDLKTLGQIQNEIMMFKEEASNFLDVTVLDYSLNGTKFFRIDEKERSKLDISKYLCQFFLKFLDFKRRNIADTIIFVLVKKVFV